MREAQRPTLKTLAKQLGLSVTTVSRALKNGPEVRPNTIAKVRAMAADIGYVPNLNGVKLKTGKTFTIYAMLRAPSAEVVGDAGSIALLHGMHSALASTPYSLTAVPLINADDDLAAVRRIVDSDLADGIIFDHTRPQDMRIKFLLEHDVPVVSFGRTELFSEHAYFDIDNQHASYQATALLLERGHRRIALIDPELDYLFARHRLAGYRQALVENGLSFDPALVSHGDLMASLSRERVGHMLRLETPPTGFVTANEVVSLGVIAALRDVGVSVGDGAEIVSRDGTQMMTFVEPAVTSCFYPLSEVGQTLGSLMLRLLDGTPVTDLQKVVRTTLS